MRYVKDICLFMLPLYREEDRKSTTWSAIVKSNLFIIQCNFSDPVSTGYSESK